MGKKKYTKKWSKESDIVYERNVHITFNVNERDRILHPIYDEKPDHLVYFQFYNEDVGKKDQNMQFFEYNCSLIKKKYPNCEMVIDIINFIDYIDIVQKLQKHIFTQENIEHKTRITINILGAKMTGICIIETIRAWNEFLKKHFSIDIYPRYVYSKNFNEEREEGAHIGQMICVKIPKHTFKTPSEDILKALYLFEYRRKNDPLGHERDYLRRKDWEDILLENNLLSRSKKPSTRQKMELEVLRNLEELNMIEKQRAGGDFHIFLTEKAKKQINYILIFLQPIIEDVWKLPKWNIGLKYSIYNSSREKSNENKVKKIHLTFNRKEKDRIINPIKENNPEKLYYFTFKQGSRTDTYENFYIQNSEEVKKILPSTEIIKVPISYVDYFENVIEIAKIIKENFEEGKKLQITLNLGTGSKLSAIALMSAFRYWNIILKKNNIAEIVIIYPYMTDYNPRKKESTHSGEIVETYFPDMEITPPSKKLIQAIFAIHEVFNINISKKKNKTLLQTELEHILFNKGILKVSKNAKKTSIAAQKARLIREKIINPLEEWGYISKSKDGNQVRLRLTTNGSNIFKIFEFFESFFAII